MEKSLYSPPVTPDWQAFIQCLKRQGTPKRVHFLELFLDGEVQEEICHRFGLLDALNPNDPFYPHKRQVMLQSFLGYDYVLCPSGVKESITNAFAHHEDITMDTAGLPRKAGRAYVNEHTGPITNWKEFEAFKWPDPNAQSTRSLEWFQKNLPENMCILGGLSGHLFEELSFLMGYETLCYALYDQRDLVAAISQKLVEMFCGVVRQFLQFDRVQAIWGSDDLGYKTGTLISPQDLREFVLPGHRQLAQITHDAGRLYLMHSCGKLDLIMEDLIEDVRIDAKHSYEDTIQDVRNFKKSHGDRLAILGGIDVDFLCRATEADIRKRVHDTLECCLPGGGYCLGTGNTVANYIPLDNYLTMLDEGAKFNR